MDVRCQICTGLLKSESGLRYIHLSTRCHFGSMLGPINSGMGPSALITIRPLRAGMGPFRLKRAPSKVGASDLDDPSKA